MNVNLHIAEGQGIAYPTMHCRTAQSSWHDLLTVISFWTNSRAHTSGSVQVVSQLLGGVAGRIREYANCPETLSTLGLAIAPVWHERSPSPHNFSSATGCSFLRLNFSTARGAELRLLTSPVLAFHLRTELPPSSASSG